MNKWIGIGRLTRDPEIRYSQGENSMCIAKYTMAIDRRGKNNKDKDEQTADFISVTAFGRNGEFAEKYLKKGMKIAVTGHIQTGSYTDKEGKKVYTTDIIAEEHDFVESKSNNTTSEQASSDGFSYVPEGIDEDLPFANPTR